MALDRYTTHLWRCTSQKAFLRGEEQCPGYTYTLADDPAPTCPRTWWWNGGRLPEKRRCGHAMENLGEYDMYAEAED